MFETYFKRRKIFTSTFTLTTLATALNVSLLQAAGLVAEDLNTYPLAEPVDNVVGVYPSSGSTDIDPNNAFLKIEFATKTDYTSTSNRRLMIYEIGAGTQVLMIDPEKGDPQQGLTSYTTDLSGVLEVNKSYGVVAESAFAGTLIAPWKTGEIPAGLWTFSTRATGDTTVDTPIGTFTPAVIEGTDPEELLSDNGFEQGLDALDLSNPRITANRTTEQALAGDYSVNLEFTDYSGVHVPHFFPWGSGVYGKALQIGATIHLPEGNLPFANIAFCGMAYYLDGTRDESCTEVQGTRTGDFLVNHVMEIDPERELWGTYQIINFGHLGPFNITVDDIHLVLHRIVDEPNKPPVVNATFSRTSTEIFFEASADDEDGSITNIQWSQLSGPSLVLNNSNTLNMSFTLPNVAEDVTAVVRLSVTDDKNAVTTKDLNILVRSQSSLNDSVKTLTLRQGLDDYLGVADTMIKTPPFNEENHGIGDTLTIWRNKHYSALLQFDLSEIPQNSEIISAELSLWNKTDSTIDGSQELVRRIQLYRLLKDWHEGNQDGTPVTEAGDHGATAEKAFDYPGDAGDISWGASSLLEDSDFDAKEVSYTDVGDSGSYQWQVTNLVKDWIRQAKPNHGIMLRTDSGYQTNHHEYRNFVSSQGEQAELRPTLTIVYNHDVPSANAGLAQENYHWDGGAISLDGSASVDKPAGNDLSLSYSWRVTKAAYGSSMLGEIVGNEMISSFTPDKAGEWELELSVINEMGELALDSTKVRVLNVSPTHPRIMITPEKLTSLKKKAVPSNIAWEKLLLEANKSSGSMHAKAMVSLVLDDASYCEAAISQAITFVADDTRYHDFSGSNVALIYDWCYNSLSDDHKSLFLGYFHDWEGNRNASDVPGWGNYWPKFNYSFAAIGLAALGDDPEAIAWINDYRYYRFQDNEIPMLDIISAGGGWPEGNIYDWIANLSRVQSVMAWQTATGEDLFLATDWFRERLGYVLLHNYPGIAEQWGIKYHPYPSTGDSERNRGTIAYYERLMALILIDRFEEAQYADQLQAYLAAPSVNQPKNFLIHDEFLWFNPEKPQKTPELLTHYAEGIGSVYMRSGWPSGADDTDTSATHITFQSGDHFSYHQHFDKNSFTLFKYDDLLLDSGNYSGDGRSYHDANYYVRTIAHNTLVVYNPTEDFVHSRPNADSNDGGQRSLFPATRAPVNVEYFKQNLKYYDTGDILRFADNPEFTYVLGDATKAYNNPNYNQGINTHLSGNVAKVSRFKREFVYLRPVETAIKEYIVILDRVGVTDAEFSGENTKLLLHLLSEPEIDGTAEYVSPGEILYRGAHNATATSGSQGKVFVKTLLPENHNIRKVGGHGEKAFWVFDKDYDFHWNENDTQGPITDFDNIPYGQWRLEIEPADRALDHNFLTVIHPTDQSTTAMADVVLVQGTGLQGAHILDPTLNRVVLFSDDFNGATPQGQMDYSVQTSQKTLHVILNLIPGASYNLSTQRNDTVWDISLRPDAAGNVQAGEGGEIRFSLD